VQRTYQYGLERISQTQVTSGTTSYYGYDAHGDVRFLADSTGKVTDTYDYDAFGNIVGSTGTTPNVYRYQGEALDAETGLYYLRARYYDPVTGRFLNVDPMADEGEHPYTYAGADPVNGHDPTGTQEVIEYALTMWLVSAHVPPPANRISCFDAIIFSMGMSASEALAQMGKCEVSPGSQPPGNAGNGGSGSKNKKKCRDVVNLPENDLDRKRVVLRMINENSASSLGKRSYGIFDTISSATGSIISWNSIELEDRYLLTVLTNRLSDPSFRSWGLALGAQAFNAGGAGYKGREYLQSSLDIYNEALDGPAGTFACKDVGAAVSACNAGPIGSGWRPRGFGPLLYWKGIVQGKPSFVIRYRLGDVRVNNTEFSPEN
jgi:RHS repeat-associated protein